MRPIAIESACEHNLKQINLQIQRQSITVITGVSGSGKSSLAFDTLLRESQRRFFTTLSHYSRQFLDLGTRPCVKHISGLSPAIALEQNETMPSRRSSIASLTELAELLGVAWARFGERFCPEHDLLTSARSVQEISQDILARFGTQQQKLAFCLPLAEQKKGHFRKVIEKFLKKGFSRFYIDGEVLTLTGVPDLNKEEKHTIKVVIDLIEVKDSVQSRMERSLVTAFELGDGHAECMTAQIDREQRKIILDLDSRLSLAAQEGCPRCSFSWPALDSRYFAANSLGRCPDCDGYGYLFESSFIQKWSDLGFDLRRRCPRMSASFLMCPSCSGSGISTKMRAIKLAGVSLHEIYQMPIGDVQKFFEHHQTDFARRSLVGNPAFERTREEIAARLAKLCELGLSYVNLQRRIRTLSGGEHQRVRLATILGESLRGVLYILDEPSQGLCEQEVLSLMNILKSLRDQGNTVVIVDHDALIMQQADWIVDLGPAGGAQGGYLLAQFQPQNAASYEDLSSTARYLSQKHQLPNLVMDRLPLDKTASSKLVIKKPNLHNLSIDEAVFQKSALNVVTGTSGAGKSSLVLGCLYEGLSIELFVKQYELSAKDQKELLALRHYEKMQGIDDVEAVELISRHAIGRSSLSMPVTYLGIFTELRQFYAKLLDAQIRGLTYADFSLARSGGRCEACKGQGEVVLQMKFLSDARIPCSECQGMRYKKEVLEVTYKGHSLGDVLNGSLQEVYELFATFRGIRRRLKPAIELGLGYLKLGQPTWSLSGGEAQRLKLAAIFQKKFDHRHVVIIDEPTVGLHFEDVRRLMKALEELLSQGVTLVLIEHHPDVLAAAHQVMTLENGSVMTYYNQSH